jgi:aminoglycoside phosphotransferase
MCICSQTQYSAKQRRHVANLETEKQRKEWLRQSGLPLTAMVGRKTRCGTAFEAISGDRQLSACKELCQRSTTRNGYIRPLRLLQVGRGSCSMANRKPVLRLAMVIISQVVVMRTSMQKTSR